MPTNLKVVQSAFPNPAQDGSYTGGIALRGGIQVVCDFYTYMSLIGAVYQVRAGTITTPLVGDVNLTDGFAEMSADAASATTIIPIYLNISLRLLTGTLHEYAAKSVATASTAGAAFVPLPLKSNGAAATSTARVAAAGGVTVTAELATTTLRHWGFANPAAGATGALPTAGYGLEWKPVAPPILAGPRCFYVQIAAATTGPSYYANFDYIEAPTATIL